jgi:hypothetical protein
MDVSDKQAAIFSSTQPNVLILTSNNADYDDDRQNEKQKDDALGPASTVAVGEVLPHDVARKLHQRLPKEVHEGVAFHVADVEHQGVVRHGVDHPVDRLLMLNFTR